MERATNSEILLRISKEKKIMKKIETKRIKYLDHIMRNSNRYNLLQNILHGKILEKRRPDKRLKNSEHGSP